MNIFIKNIGTTFEVVCNDEMIGWTTNYDEIEEIVDEFLDENDIEEIVDVIHM